MDVLHACCAGLDVHKKTVVACVRRVDPAGKVSKSTKTFATMTADLLELSDWLAMQGVKVVAMESTGSFWKPVFNLLGARFEVVLVNAHHIKQVPGRKTDVRDSEWIAQLLQHGLLRPSFIPPRPTRELRDLTPQRTQDEKRGIVPPGTIRASRMALFGIAANCHTGVFRAGCGLRAIWHNRDILEWH
jgi:transposase